jgi:hypothetical protein
MTDEEYMMKLGEIATTSARSLGWTENMEDNPVQFLVQAAYEEGWADAELSSYVSSYEVGS